MTIDPATLAEKAAVIERHLARVAEKLGAGPTDLTPMSDRTDAIVLHLWQAVQIALDLALHVCVKLGLGAPESYADAFRRLASAGHLDADLAERLARAAGFRNVVAHAYESIDLERVRRAAQDGPADLRRFLASLRDVG